MKYSDKNTKYCKKCGVVVSNLRRHLQRDRCKEVISKRTRY